MEEVNRQIPVWTGPDGIVVERGTCGTCDKEHGRRTSRCMDLEEAKHKKPSYGGTEFKR